MTPPIVCREHIYVGPTPDDMTEGIWGRRCRECHWREHVIVLREVPPGANQLHRMGHHEIGALRARLKADAVYLVRETGVDGPLIPHARITVDFRWKDKRRHDVDNALAGTKAAIDGLVGLWLVDDDSLHVEYVVRGHTGCAAEATVISVEAI